MTLRIPFCLLFACLFSLSAASLRPVQLQAQDSGNLNGKKVVLIVGEREYKTKESLQAFADEFLLPAGANCTFVLANQELPNRFPGLENLDDADLMILSVRRRNPTTEAFAHIRNYIESGKPLVAIRTSSHPFHQRKEAPPAGHAEWRTFDVDVLGGKYEGHFGNELFPNIRLVSGISIHPILQDIGDLSYTSNGSLYKSRNLRASTTVLLKGTITGKNGKKTTEPVAWTHQRGNQKVFYTSLGHTSDFELTSFRQRRSYALLRAIT